MKRKKIKVIAGSIPDKGKFLSGVFTKNKKIETKKE